MEMQLSSKKNHALWEILALDEYHCANVFNIINRYNNRNYTNHLSHLHDDI